MGDLRVFKGSFWKSIKVPLKRSIPVPKRDLWGSLKGSIRVPSRDVSGFLGRGTSVLGGMV